MDGAKGKPHGLLAPRAAGTRPLLLLRHKRVVRGALLTVALCPIHTATVHLNQSSLHSQKHTHLHHSTALAPVCLQGNHSPSASAGSWALVNQLGCWARRPARLSRAQ